MSSNDLFKSVRVNDIEFVEIIPRKREWWLKLKLKSPASHHDPGQNDKSNKSLFRRQSKQLSVGNKIDLPSQPQIDDILSLIPVADDIADMMQEATLEQLLASAILKIFIDLYNSEDGIGLFSGIERYRFLEERFQHAAIMSASLLEMWGVASRNLQVSPIEGKANNLLLKLLTMPAALGQLVIKTIAQIPRPCTMLARTWHEATKLQSEQYASGAGVEAGKQTSTVLSYSISGIEVGGSDFIVDLPVFSANTLRHEMIREPVMWHLFSALGVAFNAPAPATIAMFYNGGDIAAGKKSPSDVFWLRQKIREAFPSVALISGSTNTFLVGEGNLSIHSWVICRENNDVLNDIGLASNISIFKMMDDWTLTRHAGRVETGQMPFSFETLIEGVEIAVRVGLSPYANDLQVGALMAALKTYQELDSTIGGQSARGFGLVSLDFHSGEFETDRFAEYEQYLADNKEELRQHLLNGTLGTDKVIVS